MNRSTNYNFYLPGNSDYRDISALNYNFETIDTELKAIRDKMKEGLVRITKTYTNVTIGSSGYVSFDTFSTIVNEHTSLISTRWYLVSMTIRGWSGATLPLELLKSSDGTTFYIGGAAQTITSITIEYFFANPDAVTVPST